jgi:hypothetical protein
LSFYYRYHHHPRDPNGRRARTGLMSYLISWHAQKTC